jgi:hypothetical protein
MLSVTVKQLLTEITVGASYHCSNKKLQANAFPFEELLSTSMNGEINHNIVFSKPHLVIRL